jgi:hypothetical protein
VPSEGARSRCWCGQLSWRRQPDRCVPLGRRTPPGAAGRAAYRGGLGSPVGTRPRRRRRRAFAFGALHAGVAIAGRHSRPRMIDQFQALPVARSAMVPAASPSTSSATCSRSPHDRRRVADQVREGCPERSCRPTLLKCPALSGAPRNISTCPGLDGRADPPRQTGDIG